MSSDTWDEKGRKGEKMGRESDEKGRKSDEMGRESEEMGRKSDEKGRKRDGMGTKNETAYYRPLLYIYECLFYILIQFVLKIFFNAIIKIINFR